MKARSLALLLLASCAHSDGAGKRGVRVTTEVPSAHLLVDDFPIPSATWRAEPLPLAPGPHRLELIADGYYPVYAEVTVPQEGFETVALSPRPRVDPPQAAAHACEHP